MVGSLPAALDAYAAQLASHVANAVATARHTVPAVAARLAEVGLADAVGAELAAGLSRVPVLGKDEVLARQQADPPFGGMLAPDAPVRRVFQSPGPLYEPQLAGPDPWRWGPALQAAGFGPTDLVLNCFGYHLSPAGAMFEEGALALGARVLPGGIGNQDLQARAIADLGVTAYTGLPSYLKTIVERYAEAGLPPQRWRLARAVVTAEPLPDSLRALLQQTVPTVLMAYGTAEAGLIGYEIEPGGGLVPAPGVLVQVCSLDSGEPITEGEGEVVVTLVRPGYPLIRFGTGDLSAWRLAADGGVRLVGVLGRSGAAVKVRGMFLHPRQATAVLGGVADVTGWRFLVDRVDHRDELACEIVVRPGADAGAVVAEVTDRVRAGLRFACSVSAVDALPADAQPITDRRDWS
jgi:phenylacetate-CoA ligase